LLEISKLAGIDTVASAQASYDILNYTTQKTIIERIAAAQALADNAKMAALKEYLALLATPVTMPTPVAPPSESTGPKPPKFGVGGQPIWSWESGYDTASFSSGGSTGDTSVNITVEGSVLDGNDFQEIINRTMLDNIRSGFSRFPAGTLPDNG
jgi:hypothetical protein